MNERTSRLMKNSLIFTAVICFVLIAASGFFLNEMERTQKNVAVQYLQEVAVQYRNTIVKQIEGDFQTLNAIAALLPLEPLELVTVLDKLTLENKQNNFERMGFITTEGIGYLVDRTGIVLVDSNLNEEPFVRQALYGNNSISDPLKDNDSQRYFYGYAVPVFLEHQIIGVITATIPAETFSVIMEQSILQDKGFAHIIKEEGSVILRSRHPSAKDDLTNIFVDTELSQTVEQKLKKSLSLKEDGFFTSQYDNQERWCAFVRVGINDWYILTVVPKNQVNENFKQLLFRAVGLLLIIGGLFVLLFLYLNKTVKKSQKSLMQFAYYDTLTGLYNKQRFLIEARRLLEQRKDYALVVLDIANFKFFNELFGFEQGDKLLKHTANILKSTIIDQEIVCRDTADHFGMLVFYPSEEQLKKRMNQILKRICRFELKENQRYTIVCHCGIKTVEVDNSHLNLDVLMDHALLALQKAKDLHENTVSFYDDGLHQKAIWKNQVESRMVESLKNEEFFILLQPKVSLLQEKICGAEALVRWETKEGQIISPDDFIPIFEQNHFVLQLDLFVMEKVCQMLNEWKNQGRTPIPLSINQSRALFYQENYVENLQMIFNRYAIDASLITIEITEGIAIKNWKDILPVFAQLHHLGIAISMDDFGSGYSSLNVLRELPIDELKMDKGFLRESANEKKGQNIMRSIIGLAKQLKITTVVEGVETKEQVEFLKSVGCDHAQGYYYFRPLTIKNFEKIAFHCEEDTE